MFPSLVSIISLMSSNRLIKSLEDLTRALSLKSKSNESAEIGFSNSLSRSFLLFLNGVLMIEIGFFFSIDFSPTSSSFSSDC